MVTIIYAHPWNGSFCHGILSELINTLEQKKLVYQVIDLYKDNFNPVFTGAELAVYSKGEYKDPLVGKYQEMLAKTDKLFIIFPVWWSTEPAILKGFYDKVFLKNFAYDDGMVLKGKLQNIKKTYVLTTSNAPSIFIKLFDNYVKSILGRFVLGAVGIKHVSWHNCGNVKKSPEHREKFLSKVRSLV